MSVNKYTTAGGLQTLANGQRIWIGTKEAHDRAQQAGTLPRDCLIAITDDEDDTIVDEVLEDDPRAVTSGAVYDAIQSGGGGGGPVTADHVNMKSTYVKGFDLDNADEAIEYTLQLAKSNETDLSDKVDKVTGKGLSTNDYTDNDKARVNTLDYNTYSSSNVVLLAQNYTYNPYVTTPYVCPYDGYIQITPPTGGREAMSYLYILDENNSHGDSFLGIYGDINTRIKQTIYVKKGTHVNAYADGDSSKVEYFPLDRNYSS